jgi:hypothetical protein
MEQNYTQLNEMMTEFLAEILAKYVDNVATPKEKEAVEEYLADNPEAQELVAMMRNAPSPVVTTPTQPEFLIPVPTPTVDGWTGTFHATYSRTAVGRGAANLGTSATASDVNAPYTLFSETDAGRTLTLTAYVNEEIDHELCLTVRLDAPVERETCFAVEVLVEGVLVKEGTVCVAVGEVVGIWVFVPKPRIGDAKGIAIKFVEVLEG